MTELTDKQLEKLYEMTEIHFKWFQKNSSKVKYADVLKLNHTKMKNIINTCAECPEEMINDIFDSIVNDYMAILNDLNI